MEKKLAVRKKIRLEGYDYSQAGYYFLTICVEDGHEILGRVVVGDGVLDVPPIKPNVPQFDKYDVPFVQLSEYGIIAKKHIREIDEKYEHISIQNYVIMPNHIHILLAVLNDKKIGTSRTPSPTNAVIPAFISTLKRFIHKDCGFVLFQRGCHDRIIRNKTEYRVRWQYINNNPANWAEDDCFVDK